MASSVATWLDRWVAANQQWEWAGGRRLSFLDDFARAPFGVECCDEHLTFRLEVKPGSKAWRDWLVIRLLKELKGAFVEVEDVEKIVAGIVDAPPALVEKVRRAVK